ncbi:hypothetical protein BDY19DRAFT_902388 [Irpex rosettiformis]|uniref:Uncharacterized protein n=1 Tax=Irpex rosettiformis TaxID=378272 RepID=A0ACB8UGY7_9APHY|nr:hypothetical protein BDY19DRAFT_902388 [Irpex rosettiformis]
MGFDVMSRRVGVHSPASSSSSSPSTSRTKSLDRDKFMADAYLPKSLTPNRKHHKLLKDGSEVWSEDVERIFVEGLREYWESPWATYSRGRSRWRNQFLVEHLKKAGIIRSKKQVASHIQVLRNMWRGEPEFHLVAGGEELFAENGLLASPDRRHSPERLPTADAVSVAEASISSSATTPEYPIADFSAATLPHPKFPNKHSPMTPLRNLDAQHDSSMFTGVPPNTMAALGTSSPSPSAHRTPGSAVKLEPLHMGAGLSSFPTLPPSPMSGYLGGVNTSSTYGTGVPSNTNRLLQLSLWAEGMSAVTFDVDQMSTAMAMMIPTPSLHDPPPSILFRIKISITSIGDIHSSPNLHGLHGAITLASRWTSSAKCVTKLYSGATCISQESGVFVESLPSPQPLNSSHAVVCALPESALSRCKWLDLAEDRITQQILIDGIIVAAFVYTLERTVSPGSRPTAELVGFQKYKMPPMTATTATTNPHLHPRERTTSQPFSPLLTADGIPLPPLSPVNFYPTTATGSYHPAMGVTQQTIETQASMAAQLPRDVIDPSLMMHAGGSTNMRYPSSSTTSTPNAPMHSPSLIGGSLYR